MSTQKTRKVILRVLERGPHLTTENKRKRIHLDTVNDASFFFQTFYYEHEVGVHCF